MFGAVQTASAQTFDITQVRAACGLDAAGQLANGPACAAAIAAYRAAIATLPATQRLIAIRQLQFYIMTELPPNDPIVIVALRDLAADEQEAQQDASPT
jgi:hypothetical protein